MRCVPAAFLRLVLAGAGASAGTAASAAAARVRGNAASGLAPSGGAGAGDGVGAGPARLFPAPVLPSQNLKACLARADKDVRAQRAMQVDLGALIPHVS
eukprot:scaffold86205_cov25-Tisochrysis_lutea.AAC.3